MVVGLGRRRRWEGRREVDREGAVLEDEDTGRKRGMVEKQGVDRQGEGEIHRNKNYENDKREM